VKKNLVAAVIGYNEAVAFLSDDFLYRSGHTQLLLLQVFPLG
jgi:hypothetical protein